MFWLFVRDFYRAAASAQSSAAPAYVPPSPAAHAPESAHAGDSDLYPYLQRLSVDGEHAFGLWDSDSGFSVFSANFERVTNLSSGECAGHAWIASIHPDQQYSMNEALMIAERDHRPAQCLVQAGRVSGEDRRWLLIDIKPPTARQPAVMVLLRNVSEERALDEVLKQTQAALALSERGRSAFLSSMSHELRTPLNAIMGFSEMMKSGVFGPLGNSTYQQYAQHIHESGQTLLNKVDDLLDIASMDADGIALDEAPCNARALLAEVIEIHSHTAFTRNQQLKLDCTAAIELLADRGKLLCALSHMLANALRHSPDSADITLAARVTAHDGVILSVRDAGEGIAPAQLQLIRAALQAETTHFAIEPGGIGLGLSLAQALAASHEGRVVVDSIRHRGTVVSLMLPVARVLSGLPQKKRQRL